MAGDLWLLSARVIYGRPRYGRAVRTTICSDCAHGPQFAVGIRQRMKKGHEVGDFAVCERRRRAAI